MLVCSLISDKGDYPENLQIVFALTLIIIIYIYIYIYQHICNLSLGYGHSKVQLGAGHDKLTGTTSLSWHSQSYDVTDIVR